MLARLALPVLAALLAVTPGPAGGVWELEQLWEEDVREYVDKYTVRCPPGLCRPSCGCSSAGSV